MRRVWAAALCALSLVSCRESDGPMGGTRGGRLAVISDPPGGKIYVDGQNTGKVTPDTITGIAGLRTVRVVLDTLGLTYSYLAEVVVSGTEVTTLNGPLMARCTQETSVCARPFHEEHVIGNMRFGTNALGAFFLRSGAGGGLYWPAGTDNSYMSTGTPIFGGILNNQPVSLGVYDTEFFAGRPLPEVDVRTGGGFVLTQNTWIVPPPIAVDLFAPRGIAVEEKIAASSAVDGVFVVQLTFRNVSTDPLYRVLDVLGEQGVTYRDAYIGFALDPDIGTAGDDWVSYDAARATVFAYDAQLLEPDFLTHQTAPALVGLRVLSSPAGTNVLLNSYVNVQGSSQDWHAATTTQAGGYGMLSGTGIFAPDHPNPMIGHLPPFSGDARIFATAGPLQLAPGEEATIVFALALGVPDVGTYNSGQTVQPGDPTDTARQLYRVAATLRARLDAAEQLRPLLTQ